MDLQTLQVVVRETNKVFFHVGLPQFEAENPDDILSTLWGFKTHLKDTLEKLQNQAQKAKTIEPLVYDSLSKL